jgi:outer membrane protein, multidrug efflux system
MIRPIALFMLAALCGCAGPRPEPPAAAAVSAPAGYRTAAALDAEPVDAEWWHSFGDPVLDRIVEQALVANVDLSLAAVRVEEARALFHLAEAERNPDLEGSGGAVRDRIVTPFGTGATEVAGQGALSISYDVDLFGRLRQLSAAARASLLASQDAQATVRLAVAASTAEGYINLRGFDARLAILRAALDDRAAQLHIVRRRAEAGYSSVLEEAQAEAEYHGTEELIPAAELAITQQENGLSLLLGDTPHDIERGLALDTLTPTEAPLNLPAALLRQRPDIAEAEQQLVAADHSLDAARAAFMPDIRLSGSIGDIASSLFPPGSIKLFSIGSSILAPILDGGRLRAQEEGTAAQRDEAAFAYRKAALTAFVEVENALAALRRAGEQAQAQTAQRDALAQSLHIASNRYRAGYTPYLDQLDAQRGLLAAELSLAQIRTDRLNAAVSLYQAVGGGWKPETAELAAR